LNDLSTIDKDFSITIDGHAYTLKRPTLAVEKAYAKHLRVTAVQTLNADRPEIGEASYQNLLSLTSDKLTAGHFSYGAPGFYTSFGSPENQQVFLLEWLKETYPLGTNASIPTAERLRDLWRLPAPQPEDVEAQKKAREAGKPIPVAPRLGTVVNQLMNEYLADPLPGDTAAAAVATP